MVTHDHTRTVRVVPSIWTSHCKQSGKQNHFASKYKTQISQINKTEKSSDSDDS